MEDNDDLDEFDIAELLNVVEQAEAIQVQGIVGGPSSTRHAHGDDFDDLDMDALLRVAETAERSHGSSSGQANELNRSQSTMTRFFSPPESQVHREPLRPELRVIEPPRPTFGSILDTDNLPPPPPLPSDTTSFHPINRDALTTWVYPINYPIRLYQLNIVQKALFSNTLVALPTGLGKTFLAAVVMYNYWRWFPTSKIVFTAPTRPLVKQQIEACFKICGLPQSDTVELTGSNPKDTRRALWLSKRVFFLTPQVMENDLKNGVCPANKIVCLVVDEAHKATGNYAYTEVVRELSKAHDYFRVLALSATPGTNLINVQAVLTNLRISNVQIRTEESMDIQEFTFGKSIQTIVCSFENTVGTTNVLAKAIATFKDELVAPVLRRLKGFQAIYDDEPLRNPSFKLLQAQRQFSATSKNLSQAVKSMVFVDFSIAISLSRAFEMLYQHGIGPFLSSIDTSLQEIRNTVESGKNVAKEKFKLINNFTLKRLLDDLREKHAQPGFIGHPKLNTLLSIVLQHLSDAQDNASRSKAIIFSTYRNSVDEIVRVLTNHQPLVRCSSFVGQADSKQGSKGLNQREQQEVISKFRKDELNVLVCTSIAEEGLDIGEVDLIVCYDSQSSPIRMLQRMGRTGRQRRGRCVLLMTDQEEKKYRAAKESYAHIQQAIARGTSLTYYKPNTSVLPENYRPALCKKKLDIGVYQITAAKSRKKRSEENETVLNPDGSLNDEAKEEFLKSFCVDGESFTSLDQVANRYWPLDNPLKSSLKYLPLHTRQSSYKLVGHSHRTHQFVSLIKQMERSILNEGSQSPQSVNSDRSNDAPLNKYELLLPPRAKNRIKPQEEGEPHDKLMSPKNQTDDNDIPLDNDDNVSVASIVQDREWSPDQDAEFAIDFYNYSDSNDVPSLMDIGPSKNRKPSNSVDDTTTMDQVKIIELEEYLDTVEQKALLTEQSNNSIIQASADLRKKEQQKTNMLFDCYDLSPKLYPYEKANSTMTTIRSSTPPPAFLWVMSTPTWSEGGRRVLRKRQDGYKQIHGHYLTLGVYARNTSLPLINGQQPPTIRKESSAPTTPSFDEIEFDDSMLKELDNIAVSNTEKPALPLNKPEPEMLGDIEEAMVFNFSSQGVEMLDTIQDSAFDRNPGAAAAVSSRMNRRGVIEKDTKPDLCASIQTRIIAPSEPTEDEMFEWDFNDSMFADFIENKISLEDSMLSNNGSMLDEVVDTTVSAAADTAASSDNVRSILMQLSQPSSQTRLASLIASPEKSEPLTDEVLPSSAEVLPSSPIRRQLSSLNGIQDEEACEEISLAALQPRRRRRLIATSSPDLASSQSSRCSNQENRRPDQGNTNSQTSSLESRAWKRLKRLGEEVSQQSPKLKVQKKPRKDRQQALPHNPYFDLEAERSEDDQSTGDEDTEQGSSLMDSFINDGSSDLGPQLSSPLGADEDDSPRRQRHENMYSVYSKSLMSPEMLDSLGERTLFRDGARRPAWMERLQVDKWKDDGEQDDSEDDDSNEVDDESIGQFSSKLNEQQDSDNDFV